MVAAENLPHEHRLEVLDSIFRDRHLVTRSSDCAFLYPESAHLDLALFSVSSETGHGRCSEEEEKGLTRPSVSLIHGAPGL